jgi:hypothetical protein
MAGPKPTFSITAGAYRANTENPIGGPVRLTVRRDMDTPADGFDLLLSERSGIAPDDELTLDLGDGDREERVFTGSVVEVRPALDGCRVRAVGRMDAVLRLHVAAHYERATAGRIVHDLISQAGLSAGTIDDGPTLAYWVIDRGLSAYTHIRCLADRLGFEFWTDRQGKVMFRALGAAADLDAGLGGALVGAAAAAIGLGSDVYSFGRHLVAASGRQRAAGIGSLQVTGESPMSTNGDSTWFWLSASPDDAQGSAGSGDLAMVRLDPVARTKDLADRFAAGYLARNQRHGRRLAITVLGRPTADLGDTITVDGLADDLGNGAGYVAAVRHRFGAGSGFLTDLQLIAGTAS